MDMDVAGEDLGSCGEVGFGRAAVEEPLSARCRCTSCLSGQWWFRLVVLF